MAAWVRAWRKHVEVGYRNLDERAELDKPCGVSEGGMCGALLLLVILIELPLIVWLLS